MPHTSRLAYGYNRYLYGGVLRYGYGRFGFGNRSAGGNPNVMAPPSIVSATIDSTGQFLTIVFNKPMDGGDGFSIATPTKALTFISGDGTNTYEYNIAAGYIFNGQTPTLTYAAGDLVDLYGAALADVSGVAITNNSIAPAAVAAASHYWTLNSGTDLTDRKGSATLTKVGTITTVAGPDGSTAAVTTAGNFTAAHAATLNWPVANGDKTLAWWFKYTGTRGVDTFNGMFDKAAAGPNVIVYDVDPFHTLALTGGGVTNVLGFYDDLPAAGWHMGSLHFNSGANTLTIKVDGVNIAHPTITPGNMSGSGTFYIGKADALNNFTGALWGMGLYPSNLSADDLTWLINGGTGRQAY